jgi:hypothetical protein
MSAQNSTMRFGIYFIPPEGDFYTLGSRIVGYDIRKGVATEPLEGLIPSWSDGAREYGFHCTFTDAVYVDSASLPYIESEIDNVLVMLPRGIAYTLQVDELKISFWQDSAKAGLKFTPDAFAMMLHVLLVTQVQAKGKGSLYNERLANGELTLSPVMLEKMKRFHSPYVLDEFKPHFNLVDTYVGDDRDGLTKKLMELFNDVTTLSVTSLCLVVQDEPGKPFRIQREFGL